MRRLDVDMVVLKLCCLVGAIAFFWGAFVYITAPSPQPIGCCICVIIGIVSLFVMVTMPSVWKNKRR